MRNIKIILNALRTLSFQKVLKLSQLILAHPLFSFMGFYATLKSFALAQKYFPKSHSNNGIGNAFRHSLWSCLITMYCSKISSAQKALAYSKKMTDHHEQLFPNQPLETKMDLHNNQVGLQLFEDMLPGIHRQFFETGFFVEKLLQKTKTAKVLGNTDEELDQELVYLKE